MLDLRILDVTGESPRSIGFACIGRVRDGALADYRVMVYDATDGLMSEGTVRRYARWSAPVHDLVLRGLCRALCGAERIVPSKLSRGRAMPKSTLVSIALHPGGFQDAARPLMTWRVDFEGAHFVCSVRDVEAGETRTKEVLTRPRQGASCWEVVLRLWSVDLYGKSQVGRRFPPLEVPLRGEPGAHYVRISDIPAHVRPTFERHMFGSAFPHVEGVPDAVFPWDWTDFLEGNR